MAVCKNPNCKKKFVQKYLTTERFCSMACAFATLPNNGLAKSPKKPIQRLSGKKKKETAAYLKKRLEFLEKPENKICPITGERTTDVHHKKGRTGSLFLDENHWVALSRKGHKIVEENPLWAKENGYSESRLTK